MIFNSILITIRSCWLAWVPGRSRGKDIREHKLDRYPGGLSVSLRYMYRKERSDDFHFNRWISIPFRNAYETVHLKILTIVFLTWESEVEVNGITLEEEHILYLFFLTAAWSRKSEHRAIVSQIYFGMQGIRDYSSRYYCKCITLRWINNIHLKYDTRYYADQYDIIVVSPP